MRIVINTPSGTIGRGLASRLLDAGAQLTVLARSPEKVAELAARGARVVAGSLEDPGALDQALTDASALFWLTPSPPGPDGASWAATAAQHAADRAAALGVQRVVVLSSMGAHSGPGTGPVGGLLAVEEAFRARCRNVVVLRPGFFMENLLRDLPSIAADGAIYSPNPTTKALPMVATVDIAARAAAYLLDPRWTGHAIVGVHGPKDVSYQEAARVLGAALGRPVRHVQTTLEQTRQGLTAAGLPDHAVRSYLELFQAVHDGRMDPAEPRSHDTTTQTSLFEFATSTLLPALRAAEGNPAVAPEWIPRVNAIMTAWELGDTETYRRLLAPDARMTIPAYQLDVRGFEAIWAIRTSMRPLEQGPLDLHTLDSHVVTGTTVTAQAHVIRRSDGQFSQHATVRFELDATGKLRHYHQDVLWRAPG